MEKKGRERERRQEASGDIVVTCLPHFHKERGEGLVGEGRSKIRVGTVMGGDREKRVMFRRERVRKRRMGNNKEEEGMS